MNLAEPRPDFPGDLNARAGPLFMGIVNVTPDSFYDGGKHSRTEPAVNHALSLRDEGADILDIGGESTRPGSKPVGISEEIDRVVPVVRQLRERGVEVTISVDTKKSAVAKEALAAGADWINDVSALEADPDMASLVAEHNVPVVLMHMQGTPDTMQNDPQYNDVVDDICNYFKQRIDHARSAGIRPEQIILDPGIGFGKTVKHNRSILMGIDRFHQLDHPLLIGHSRKSFLESVLNLPADQRLNGTLAVSSELVRAGVDILRVHDIREHRELSRTLTWLYEESPDEN